MKKVTHKKLVRDKIPQIIHADSAEAVTRALSDSEFRIALLDKLIEEATELRDSGGDIDERADVAEVLRALDEAFSYSAEDVEQARRLKADRRGGFADKIFLEEVIIGEEAPRG